MSICVMVKVPEGLVLAADSAATVNASPVTEGGDPGPSGVLKVFFNATKVFQIRDLPVGVLTWGAGSFRARTVASLVEEFENEKDVQQINWSNLNVETLASDFWRFMNARSEELLPKVPKDGRPKTGFVICGYSGSEFFPEEYVAVVPTGSPRRLRPPNHNQPDFGANWFGSTDAIVRLHHGRDDRLFDLLLQAGTPEKQLAQLKTRISQHLQYQVLFHSMPLGDAVDFADFLVWTTIQRFRFVMGAELCGGPVDIATITRKDGFEWIRRKRRSSKWKMSRNRTHKPEHTEQHRTTT